MSPLIKMLRDLDKAARADEMAGSQDPETCRQIQLKFARIWGASLENMKEWEDTVKRVLDSARDKEPWWEPDFNPDYGIECSVTVKDLKVLAGMVGWRKPS